MMFLGIFIFLSPFLFIHHFEDKKFGFAVILSTTLSFHLFAAIVTQMLGVFNYWTVVGLNIFALLAALFFFGAPKIKLFHFFSFDKTLLAVLAISFITLYGVHYNYKGEYSTTLSSQQQNTEALVYKYPYYSDEWYAAALIKESIDSQSLPTTNPLSGRKEYFLNLELAFHSFLAEVVLLLQLDPIVDYPILSLLAGMLMVLLVYLFLTQNGVSRLAGATSGLSLLYIINGAVLPGIWYLIPLNLGIIAMLLALYFLSLGRISMSLWMAFLTLILYPPLVIFYTTALLLYLAFASKAIFKNKFRIFKRYILLVFNAALIVLLFLSFRAPIFFGVKLLFLLGIASAIAIVLYPLKELKKIKHILRTYSYSLVCLFYTAVLVSYFINLAGNLYGYISSKIAYGTFIPGTLPNYSLYAVVPIPILLAAALGLWALWRRKRHWLPGVLAIGLIYWAVYAHSIFRFIIEYQRVIFATSVLLVLISGFGLQRLIEILNEAKFFRHKNFLTYLLAGILLFFFVLSFSYTKREAWKKLTVTHIETGEILRSRAPANKFLHEDDLEIFKNIHGEKFLSVPWKGTVIGVATDNYPILTKAGTITMGNELNQRLAGADCEGLLKIAKEYSVKYMYFPHLSCDRLRKLAKSREGMYLYEVEK